MACGDNKQRLISGDDATVATAALDAVITELIAHHERSAREISAETTKVYGVLNRNPGLVGRPVMVFQEGKLAGREAELVALSAFIAMVLAAKGEVLTAEMVLDTDPRAETHDQSR